MTSREAFVIAWLFYTLSLTVCAFRGDHKRLEQRVETLERSTRSSADRTLNNAKREG